MLAGTWRWAGLGQAALGRNPDECKGQKMPLGPLVGTFLAELVMAAVIKPGAAAHERGRLAMGCAERA